MGGGPRGGGPRGGGGDWLQIGPASVVPVELCVVKVVVDTSLCNHIISDHNL